MRLMIISLLFIIGIYGDNDTNLMMVNNYEPDYCFEDRFQVALNVLAQYSEIWWNRIEDLEYDPEVEHFDDYIDCMYMCGQTYEPQCGSDGQTYGNACIADCYVDLYIPGACNETQAEESNDGRRLLEKIVQNEDPHYATDSLMDHIALFVDLWSHESTATALLDFVYSNLKDNDECEVGFYCRMYIGPDRELFQSFFETYQLYLNVSSVAEIVAAGFNSIINPDHPTAMPEFTHITNEEVRTWIANIAYAYQRFITFTASSEAFSLNSCAESDVCKDIYEEFNIWQTVLMVENYFVKNKGEKATFEIQKLFGDAFEAPVGSDIPRVVEKIVYYAVLGQFPESEIMLQRILNCMYAKDHDIDNTPEYCHHRECTGKSYMNCGDPGKIHKAIEDMKSLSALLFGDRNMSISVELMECLVDKHNCFEQIVKAFKHMFYHQIPMDTLFTPNAAPVKLMEKLFPHKFHSEIVMADFIELITAADVYVIFQTWIPDLPEGLFVPIPDDFNLKRELDKFFILADEFAAMADSVEIINDCQSSTAHIPFKWDTHNNKKLGQEDVGKFMDDIIDFKVSQDPNERNVTQNN